MIKPAIFLTLYALVGVTGWSTYQGITTDKNLDTGLNQLTHQFTKTSTNKPEDTNFYRWKDYQGDWHYETLGFPAVSENKYENELNFLRSLPKEALPIEFDISEEDENLLGDIPGLREIAELINNAKQLETLLQARKENMDAISQKLKDE